MSKKDLQYYKALDYNIIIEKQEMDNESWFIAYTNELGKFSCYGQGITQIEALKDFHKEKDDFIEYLFNESKIIPEPKKEESYNFSGIFNVRTSSIIHANLVNQAKDLNISLNLYLNQILASAVERKTVECEIMNKLSEITSQLSSHHHEVTKQLHYKGIKWPNYSDWDAKYFFDSPYLKTA